MGNPHTDPAEMHRIQPVVVSQLPWRGHGLGVENESGIFHGGLGTVSPEAAYGQVGFKCCKS